MNYEKEYAKVVYQLGESAHMVEELLTVYAEHMTILAEVQSVLGISEHDIKRSYFEVIKTKK